MNLGKRLSIGISGPVVLFCAVNTAQAVVNIDFEEAGFAPNTSVQAHAPDGTIIAPIVSGTNPDAQAFSVREAATDEEIVDISGSDPGHGKVWRISDQGDTGNLQTRPHTPHAGNLPSTATKQTSGETGAIDDFGGEVVTTSTYYAQFDFKSATGTAQTDFALNASAACGDDCRHAFVRIIDDGTGFDLGFFETGDNSGTLSCGSFPFTLLDLNLSYTDWHTIGISIDFQDGFGPGGFGAEGNDVVKIFVNGTEVLSGTSWETCYAYVGGGQPRSVDRMVFYRASTAESDVGGGLYIDNILISDTAPAGPPTPVPEPNAIVYLLYGLAGLVLVSVFRNRLRWKS